MKRLNIEATNLGLACGDKFKFDLDHIKVDPIGDKAVRLVATNSKALAITKATAPEGPIDGWIPREALVPRKSKRPPPTSVSLLVGDDKVEEVPEFGAGSYRVHLNRAATRGFPLYKEVVPDIRNHDRRYAVVALDARLLLDLALALGKQERSHPPSRVCLIVRTVQALDVEGVTAGVDQCGPAPITVLSASNPDAVGVLMPCSMTAKQAYGDHLAAIEALGLTEPKATTAEATPAEGKR